jgi:GLPGLI family protein
MFKKILIGLVGCVGLCAVSQAQRRLTEATFIYKVHFDDTAAATKISSQAATTTCYLKGVSSRTDLVTAAGKQSTLFLAKTEQVVLLKEYGGQRYMTRLTKAQWEQSNKKYREASLTFVSDTLRLAGYSCNKVVATIKDSSTITIWYTKELIPLNKTYLPLADAVPGLILAFEVLAADSKVRYQIEQIIFGPVQQMLFDIPESGYRLLEN